MVIWDAGTVADGAKGCNEEVKLKVVLLIVVVIAFKHQVFEYVMLLHFEKFKIFIFLFLI